MHFEEILKSLQIEENIELNTKLKRIRDLEIELDKYRTKKGKNEEVIRKRDKNNSNNNFDNSRVISEIEDKLLTEKKLLVNNCYFEVEARVKKINELMENIKKEAFFIKTQNFNMKNKAFENPTLEELINKSKTRDIFI